LIIKSAGIDIGSRKVKLVIVEDGEIIHSVKRENSFDTLRVCGEMLKDLPYDIITTTGYGRHLFSEKYKSNVISEIKAFAIGAKALFPSCRIILDIGGQDTKAISLDEEGRVRKFEMNDKCAAGTGRFLEIISKLLGILLTSLVMMLFLQKKLKK